MNKARKYSNAVPLVRALARFRADDRGNVALLFGLSSIMLFTAMGAGIDLSRAYLAKQKLSQVATMACQYAVRPVIVDTATSSYGGSNGGATYVTNVNNFITTTWQSQNVNLTQTASTPFTYTKDASSNVTPEVNLSAAVPTTFMNILGYTQIPIASQAHCFAVQRTPESPFLLKESFEANGPGGWYDFHKPDGSAGTQASPTGFTTAVAYTGDNGAQWHVTGYCFEHDNIGGTKSTVADGHYSVELDCDNGNGTKGNSSISTEKYMEAGTYELRYNYASRIAYSNYEPTYICGTTAGDVQWANDTSSVNPVPNVSRTNQMNVYLDLNTSTPSAPPTHSTIDLTQQLAGSNLIDVCVYGQSWIERSVSITVTTPGYYWLSFAADGASDSYGAQLDNVRLCRMKCPSTVQDNFASVWASNKLLFQDDFESPTYAFNGNGYTESGNMYNSQGTSSSGGTACNGTGGWPCLSPSGWADAPFNKTTYWTNATYPQMCPNTNSECVELSGSWGVNSLISRPFLLVPGYYQVSYKYNSVVSFANLSSTYCGTTPANANISMLSGNSSAGKYINIGGNAGVKNNDTNTIGVFMAHAEMASTPNATSTQGAATTFYNPIEKNTTTTANNPPNAINLTNYNAAQDNPLLDICGYAPTWQSRSRAILIQKPAYYWLTIADLATSDGIGGIVDDVKLTALGSLYMSSPPSNPVTIPVKSPLPGSTINYTGFSITADVLRP